MRILKMIASKISELVADVRDKVDQVRDRIRDEADRIEGKIDKHRDDRIADRLDELAAAGGQKLKWRTSIVDLLKVIGIDSSLETRKEMAADFGYDGGEFTGSDKQNIWLHKETFERLGRFHGIRLPRPE